MLFAPILQLRNSAIHRNRSQAARAETLLDNSGADRDDPGLTRTIDACLTWLSHAQDGSRTRDGGVARDYNLNTGWNSSYPETTGYIVPTMLEVGRRRGEGPDGELHGRARRMLDWLVSIQLPCGGFQGGMVDQTPVVPVTFNTGQILMGLAAGTASFGAAYRQPLLDAAGWLIETQDPDGCWRRHPTLFAKAGEKVYEMHVAWGLMEAYRVEPDPRFRDAALANVRWALTHQLPNGAFERCDLEDPTKPLTHTIGYALRGVIEAYLLSREPSFLAAARRTADGLLTTIRPDGHLAGRQDLKWKGRVPWVCLTGSAQIAHSFLLLARETGVARYAEAARHLNRYVRSTVRLSGPPEIVGGVKGSFPVEGHYGQDSYLNWAAKFLIDSCIFEYKMMQNERWDGSGPEHREASQRWTTQRERVSIS